MRFFHRIISYLIAFLLQAKYEELQRKVEPSAADVRTLSSLIMQRAVTTHLMDDATELYFVRNLVIDGQAFRVTWSCGWFLQLLVERERLDFRSEALQTMAKTKKRLS